MDYIFPTGLMGALILIAGAAWPDPKKIKHPVKSVKNWLLATGGLTMLIYSVMNFLQGGPVFFIFLQSLVVIASILMMLNIPDTINSPIIIICGIALSIWSISLFGNYNTLFFIAGLSGIGLGYVFKMATLRRSAALTLGGILIALFSYFEANWIFFWLNVFFAIFSAYYLYKAASRENL